MSNKISAYVEGVRGFRREFLPAQATLLERVAVNLAALVIGLPESQAWRSFPKVPSPEVAWDSPETDPKAIESELKEILRESATSS